MNSWKRRQSGLRKRTSNVPYDHEYNNWFLFLDDERTIEMAYPDEKPGEFHVARSTEEAKALVKELGIPVFMSLDHDLGGDDTSMEFLKWLAQADDSPFDTYDHDVPGFYVHSANPIGSENIKSFITSWARSLAFDDGGEF